MNKSLQIGKIAILVFIILILAGTLIKGIYSGNKESYVNDLNFKESISSVNIDLSSGDVDVFKSTGNEVKVKEKSYGYDKSRLNVDVQGSELRIKEKSRFHFFFSFYNRKTTIEVYLPEKVYEKFKIDSTSGKYLVSDIKIKDMDIESTSGTIELNNVSSEDLKVDMTSGKAIINGSSKKVRLNMTSGNIELKSNTELEALDIDMTSGSVKMNLPETSNFTVNSDIISGKINNDFKNINSDAKAEKVAQFNIALTSGKVWLQSN